MTKQQFIEQLIERLAQECERQGDEVSAWRLRTTSEPWNGAMETAMSTLIDEYTAWIRKEQA